MKATQSGRAVDLSDEVCPEERCEVDRDGQIVFSDANHLTASYSRSLADVLGAEIKLMLEATH